MQRQRMAAKSAGVFSRHFHSEIPDLSLPQLEDIFKRFSGDKNTVENQSMFGTRQLPKIALPNKHGLRETARVPERHVEFHVVDDVSPQRVSQALATLCKPELPPSTLLFGLELS